MYYGLSEVRFLMGICIGIVVAAFLELITQGDNGNNVISKGLLPIAVLILFYTYGR